MAFRSDHPFDANRCPRARRPPGRGKSGNRGNTGDKGGGADPRPAQQPRPPQTLPPPPQMQMQLPPPPQMQLPSMWMQPMPSLQPQQPWQMPQSHTPPSWQMPPPPRQQTQPPRPDPPPQWGDGYGHGDDLGIPTRPNPPQQWGDGYGDDLAAFAGAGYTAFGPPLDTELSSRVLVCCVDEELTREVAELDKSDQILCTRGGPWTAVSNPVRVEEVMRKGEARDVKEARAVSCAFFEAHLQNVERGGQIEGSLIERAFDKGLIRSHDWSDGQRAPERTREAINHIAMKVVDGRTVALGCTCPMDGGACHRNIIRRAVLRAAMRKKQELDSRRRDRDRRQRSRSRSPPPPPFGGHRSHAPLRFGERPSLG